MVLRHKCWKKAPISCQLRQIQFQWCEKVRDDNDLRDSRTTCGIPKIMSYQHFSEIRQLIIRIFLPNFLTLAPGGCGIWGGRWSLSPKLSNRFHHLKAKGMGCHSLGSYLCHYLLRCLLRCWETFGRARVRSGSWVLQLGYCYLCW